MSNLVKTISFRVKDDQGKVRDIQLHECVWYGLFADNRVKVDREGIGRAEGILSADQVRQLKNLSWLKTQHPFSDYFFNVRMQAEQPHSTDEDEEMKGKLHDYLSSRD
jgi:hypothetical protein